MSINKSIPLGKPYVFTLMALLFAGIFLTVALRLTKGTNDALMIGLVGTGVGILVCAITNLLYYLPSDSLFIRLITPGISSILLFVLINRTSLMDMLLFSFFGVINLGLGIFWYVSINKLRKSES